LIIAGAFLLMRRDAVQAKSLVAAERTRFAIEAAIEDVNLRAREDLSSELFTDLKALGTLDAFIHHFGPDERMARFWAVSFAGDGHGGGEYTDAIWSGDRTSDYEIRISTPPPESAMVDAFPAQGWRQRASINIELFCSAGWLLPGKPKVTLTDLGGDWNATYVNWFAAALAQAGVDCQLTTL
jgi:hypothetical protein